MTLTEQLNCAKAVLDQMRERQSRWLKAQEAIVKTLEKCLHLEEVTVEILANKPTEASK